MSAPLTTTTAASMQVSPFVPIWNLPFHMTPVVVTLALILLHQQLLPRRALLRLFLTLRLLVTLLVAVLLRALVLLLHHP